MKKQMKPLEMLPTLLTLGNLFSGFLAIAKLTDSLHSTAAAQRIDLYSQAIWYVFLAMIFDAVDGKVARMFGAASEFGSQIDSLSDVISFGAAPALLFKVMVEAHPGVLSPKAALLLAVVYLACAALRLARFNVETTPDESSHKRFKGLPSPAAAGCVLSLGFINIHLDSENAHSWVLWTMPWVVPFIGFLMVSRFPYIHITHALFQDRRPFRFLVLLIFGAALAIWVPEFALPIVVILYVISGPLTWARHRLQRGHVPAAGPPVTDGEDVDEDIL
jgi:CDP-diacylglycerol--serine O-phosphatidyltransferase